MNKSRILVSVLLCSAMSYVAIAADEADKQMYTGSTPHSDASTQSHEAQINYRYLQSKIAYGQATLAETRKALADPDPYSLSNTVHALFSMRWQRGTIHLLNAMWAMDREKYPGLAWDLIAEPPVRIALASTINRIRIVHTEEYQAYIRAFKDDPEEFNRAQVSVALGYNGATGDLPYLQAMANGENHYVAQSAITALSVFGGDQARDILIKLLERHHDTPRGDLMQQMLKKAYHWPPKKPAVPNNK